MTGLLSPVALADLTVRATVVLALSLALAWSVRKQPAVVRHGLWTATFVGLLLLPVTASFLPGWEVPVLPAPGQPTAALSDAGGPFLSDAGDGSVSDQPALGAANGESRGANATRSAFGAPPTTAEGRSDAPVSAMGVGKSFSAWSASTLLVLWALGTGAALGSLLLGAWRFHIRVGAARPIHDTVWTRTVERLSGHLGIRRPVGVLLSASAETPMTGGLLRPVVLLPESALEWTTARRDCVLAHELVHVKRHDALRQLIGHAALALYWFHPLCWVASRWAVLSREQACDEQVVAMGTQPSDYATHLLELATGMRRTPALAALSMVQPPNLEKRIMAILAHRHPRSTRLAGALILLSAGAVSVSAAITRPVPAHLSPTPTPPTPSMSEPEADVAALPDLTGNAWNQEVTCRAEGLRGSFSGTFNSDGGRSEHSGWHNGDRSIQKYDGDLRLCMRMHGEVVLSDDAMSVRAVGRDSWVVLESERDVLRRLVITEGPRGIEYVWSVGGVENEYGDEAREWHDRMFTVMSGFWEAARIRGEESSLKGRISSYRGRVSSMRGKISSHRGHVSSLNGRISSTRGRLSSLRGRISSHRGHVSSLNGRISSIRGRMSGLRSAARNTENDDTRVRLEDELAEYEEQIREIQREIVDYDLEARVAEVEAEIAGIDVEGRVRELQQEIEDYNVEEKVREVERQIAEFDLDARVRAVEREIEELNAQERALEIERRLQPELDALRRMMRSD